ncbi:MAG: DNA-3-methyladenine glycosylase, partial [Candidatus Bathyarchaeota archaeon]|nr:DNA-3-methyladenine glycosylase [Candidatus Bathyarchaeota archaeon]
HREGEVGAVLIRALEPLEGVENMRENRGVTDIHNLTSGPGKLARAMSVTNKFNGLDITRADSEIFVSRGTGEDLDVGTSQRIGVTEDLPEELRFFIKGNRFVSR